MQLGVFSPILRLHSTADRFIAKEPWRFGEVARRLIGESLRLRHRLVPYIATMALRASEEGAPLVSPMYYDHPAETPPTYGVPNQFMFGTEPLVAPITSPPVGLDTRLGAVNAWLPEGEWIDVFTGLRYRGGRTIALHRDLDSIPVLVRPGTMLPLAADGSGTDLPDRVELHVFAGGDGEFTLAEDRDDERWARTTFTPPRRRARHRRRRGRARHAARSAPTSSCRTASPTPSRSTSACSTLAEEHRPASPSEPPATTGRARLFALLDRAHIANPVKNAIYDAVQAAPAPATPRSS